MLHLPVRRFGRSYTSAETLPVHDARNGEVLAQMSFANAGLIRRDAAKKVPAAREALATLTVKELIALVQEAGRRLVTDALPCGDQALGIEHFLQLTSRATGLPEVLVRANLAKLHHVCTHVHEILDGLSRGMDLSVLDTGLGVHGTMPVSYVPTARSLAAVLPSNSPGVHSLWIPALALKTPVALKPGSTDPFVPDRMIAAMIAAGLPAEAFGFYPTDHAGADALVDAHDRTLVFGGPAVSARYAHTPSVEVHGPGYSKILLGDDQAPHWAHHVDLIATSVATNGGRSCINASAVTTPAHAAELAAGLDQALAAHTAAALEDPEATLAAFVQHETAVALNERIDTLLAQPGATDVSTARRGSPRLVVHDGLTVLLPTVVLCTDPAHPLANTEFGFPFVSVVQQPTKQALDWLGSTLVLTALTEHAALRRTLLAMPTIDRLHLGPVPTHRIRWDQPHEGNLLEWLYRRRAVATAQFGAWA